MGWGEGGPLSRRLAIFSIFPERDIQRGDQGTTGLLQAQQVDISGVCPKQWTLSARGLPARAWDQLCKLGLGERGAEEGGGAWLHPAGSGGSSASWCWNPKR